MFKLKEDRINTRAMIYFIVSFINLSILSSCSKTNAPNMFPAPEINLKKSGKIAYKIDTLLIDTTINTTFEGNIGVHNNKLYFIDKLFCTIHFFDTTGRITFKTLGIGRGLTETTIGRIYAHTFIDNGYLCLQGTTDDVHLFDEDYKTDRKKSYRKVRKPYRLGDKIGYDQFELYSMGYPLVCRSYKNSVFTNNRAEDPTFNYFQTPDIFVQEFRNITKQRLDKKRTGRLLGRGMPNIDEELQELTELSFNTKRYRMDGIKSDTILQYTFILKNIGDKPLFIRSINPSCLCTSYYLSKKEITQQDTAKIVLTVDTKDKKGFYEINTIVIANTKEKHYLLKLIGEIKK